MFYLQLESTADRPYQHSYPCNADLDSFQSYPIITVAGFVIRINHDEAETPRLPFLVHPQSQLSTDFFSFHRVVQPRVGSSLPKLFLLGYTSL